MRLRHIEIIQALCQTGELKSAAQMLDICTQTLEQTLQDAERQLGFLLFARVRGRFQPTPETLRMQAEIAAVQSQVERLQRLADSLREHQDPALHVVCTASLAHQLLPQSIAALRRRFRETPCTLGVQNTDEMVRSLLLHQTDVGLSLHCPDHPSITSQVLAEGKLQLLAPQGWLSPKHRYIALHELAGQAMIGLEGEDPLSLVLEHRLQSLNPPPRIQTRVQTYQMMRSMVEAGEGLAVVDPFTAAGARAQGLDTCPLSPAVPVTLYALTRSAASSSAAEKTLLEIIAQNAQALLSPVRE
ncbi:LysR family transcriptional regulator [Pseudomonas putida]|jgi:DNA-binding transcriptional LysR family regulator|nr:LysR family transcriptional regulator [Pseudomonas putida]